MISLRTFYFLGAFLFGVGLLAGIYNLANAWALVSNGSKVQTIAGLAFNLLMVLLFIGLYRQAPRFTPEQEKQQEEVLNGVSVKNKS